MHKSITPLSAREVSLIGREGFTAVGGAVGLYLRVAGNSRYFVFRYRAKSGKRTMVCKLPMG